MVGQRDNPLPLGFITDFRAAEDDLDFRTDTFDGGNDLGRLRDIPDINPETDDLRVLCENFFRDFERTLVDIKLADLRTRLQFAEVGEKIAQPERGVDELRVERGEHDVRHRGSFIFLRAHGRRPRDRDRPLPGRISFDDESAAVRIDMSEYMEKHTVARLIRRAARYTSGTRKAASSAKLCAANLTR